MKIIAIAFKTFLIIFIFSFLFSSCEKEIIESEISQEETASKLEIKGSEIKSKGNPGQFFYLPGPGEMVGFHHVPYSGQDSMILRFYSDLQAYGSINSIASKWQEQMGMPLWAESVVLENDSGQTSFAVIPFTENGSTELKTIFVLAEYEGHWFFEGWNVRLVKKAIDAEGVPDAKMQTLIDFYNFYYYGHWDPNSGAEARSTTIVCERVIYLSHGSNICLEVCLSCMSSAFASIECPAPYNFVIRLEINTSCPGGGGPGGGSGSEPSDPLLNTGGWNPYFGTIMTDGNPISWVSNEGMADPVWPGGISAPFDDFDDGQEKNDQIFKGTELFLLLRDMIEDMGLDITLLDLRDLLLEDDLECLEDDAPEVCVMLLLIGEEIAPEIIPASFKNNTTLSTAELVSFLNYLKDIENLLGQSFSSDHLEWIFESDENFLMAMELLELLEDEEFSEEAADYMNFCLNVLMEDEDFISTRFIELYNLVNDDPMFLLNDCFTNSDFDPDFWKHLANFVPTQPVLDKINNLPGNYSIQDIESAHGKRLNMDYFGVNIDLLPLKPDGTRYDEDELLSYFRKNINQFHSINTTEFIPFPEDEVLWQSNNPLTALISIKIWPDDGTVICSDFTNCCWVFTTLKAPAWLEGWLVGDPGWDGYHPVSGNRQFGWSNVGGQIKMFTKGVDRVTNWYHYAFGYGEKKAFQGADQLWQSMEEELADFINNHGGEAEVFTTQRSFRPDWEEIRNILKSQNPINAVPCQ